MPLAETIHGLCGPSTEILLAFTKRCEHNVRFFEEMAARGFEYSMVPSSSLHAKDRAESVISAVIHMRRRFPIEPELLPLLESQESFRAKDGETFLLCCSDRCEDLKDALLLAERTIRAEDVICAATYAFAEGAVHKSTIAYALPPATRCPEG